jgi:hypothetical protein
MIRFHENLRISVKMSPLERRTGHASSGNLATVVSRRVHGIALLAHINRGLPLLKIFHRSLALCRTLAFTFTEKRFAIKCSRLQDFLKHFYGITFFVTQFLFLLFIILVFLVLRILFTNDVMLFLMNVIFVVSYVYYCRIGGSS